jgi:PAS domain S-box-containing protein
MNEVKSESTKRNSPELPVDDSASPSVLLVDDQPARLLTYESLLSGVGVTCVRALSGPEALGRLLRQSFALILLDVSMPGMDGFETARMIREHPRFERTPIIFVTGVHVSELDSLRGYEVGAIDYISVPVVPEILRSKVALLVELYRRRKELEALNRTLEATRANLEIERHAQQRESEARYRAIFENPMALTVVIGAVRDEAGEAIDWEYLEANQNALRVYDRTYDQLVGKRMSVALPERASQLMPLCARTIAEGTPQRYEMRAGGTDFVMCLFPMSKDVLVSSGFDITTRVQAEQETQRLFEHDRAEKEWLAAVLDSMNEEVYFTDTDRKYTYANPAAVREFGHETIAGIPVEEVISKLEVLRLDGTPRPVEESPPLRALQGEVIRGEEQLVRTPRTGELRTRQVSSAPVRGPDGKIRGAVSVVRDVTEQRRVDAELRLRAEELKDADKRKDEFIAMLAHELRNPLVPIRTAVELLKKARDQPSIIESIRPMMERQVTHMVRLIDDLLDVSRITSGKIELKRETVRLGTLVGGAVDANREVIDDAGLALSVHLADPDLVLNVDPTRFSQILSNVIQNAGKFTPAGGRIAVQSALEQSDSAKPAALVIRIADTGVGIAESMLPRIFELFAQAGAVGHGRQSGLGIGLALSRRLAELHGGSLEARSDGLGKGSEFELRIPMEDEVRTIEREASATNRSLEGVRVAIIDDNRDAADILGILISEQAGEVRVAYDGASGLHVAQEFKPEVVLLDIGLPDMDGYETCRRLRAIFGRDISIIALTGWGQDRDKQRAFDAGFDAHLTKPADPQQLSETIRTFKKKEKLPGSARC